MIKIKYISLLEYFLCFLVILSCRTVYVHSINYNISTIVSLMLMFVIIFLIFIRHDKKIKTKKIFFIVFLICYIFFYLIMAVKTNVMSFVKNFLIILPLFMIYLSMLNRNELGELLKKYSRIIIGLAVCSLFFYLFGSCMKVLKPNIVTILEWGGNTKVNGYFFLHFDVQTTSFFGKSILRNTGIFVEGPMYSLQLILAYAFILFEDRKVINKKSIILAITLFTTLSTTGMIIFVILSFYKFLKFGEKKTKILILPIALIICVFAVIILFNDKKNDTNSNSYSIRTDDIKVAIMSFKNNPIFGDGYMNNSVAISNMSDFRLYNTGLSSTFAVILIQGGIYFSIIYILPIIFLMVKSYREKDYEIFVIAIVEFLLYFTTIFQYTNLMMFLIAFNINSILNIEDKLCDTKL